VFGAVAVEGGPRCPRFLEWLWARHGQPAPPRRLSRRGRGAPVRRGHRALMSGFCAPPQDPPEISPPSALISRLCRTGAQDREISTRWPGRTASTRAAATEARRGRRLSVMGPKLRRSARHRGPPSLSQPRPPTRSTPAVRRPANQPCGGLVRTYACTGRCQECPECARICHLAHVQPRPRRRDQRARCRTDRRAGPPRQFDA
jgi:hypothetical protein